MFTHPHSAADAEDAAQVLADLAKGAGSIRGQVSAWLHTVALRHALRVP